MLLTLVKLDPDGALSGQVRGGTEFLPTTTIHRHLAELHGNDISY